MFTPKQSKHFQINQPKKQQQQQPSLKYSKTIVATPHTSFCHGEQLHI